jgi:hypothetical protein
MSFNFESTPPPEVAVYVKRFVTLQSEIDGFTNVKLSKLGCEKVRRFQKFKFMFQYLSTN